MLVVGIIKDSCIVNLSFWELIFCKIDEVVLHDVELVQVSQGVNAHFFCDLLFILVFAELSAKSVIDSLAS